MPAPVELDLSITLHLGQATPEEPSSSNYFSLIILAGTYIKIEKNIDAIILTRQEGNGKKDEES